MIFPVIMMVATIQKSEGTIGQETFNSVWDMSAV